MTIVLLAAVLYTTLQPAASIVQSVFSDKALGNPASAAIVQYRVCQPFPGNRTSADTMNVFVTSSSSSPPTNYCVNRTYRKPSEALRYRIIAAFENGLKSNTKNEIYASNYLTYAYRRRSSTLIGIPLRDSNVLLMVCNCRRLSDARDFTSFAPNVVLYDNSLRLVNLLIPRIDVATKHGAARSQFLVSPEGVGDAHFPQERYVTKHVAPLADSRPLTFMPKGRVEFAIINLYTHTIIMEAQVRRHLDASP